jgi:hypothetical protein
VTKIGPAVSVAVDGIFLLLIASFKLFRFKTNNTKLHEYLIILILAVHSTMCTLTNTNNLPQWLNGPGIDEKRLTFQRSFYLVFIFPLMSFEKIVIFVGPMYLIA